MLKKQGYTIINLKETASTNDYAKKIAREGASDRTVVRAEGQTAGKGRLGRSFDSQRGKGIYMSILLRPKLTPEQTGRLTLVAATAVHEAIKEVCSLDTGIKWPNDIVADGKKLCGILTEMSADSAGVKYVIVGIGVNVLNETFGEELSQAATSVYMQTGKRIKIDGLAEAILDKFDSYYIKYGEAGKLSVIREKYDKCLIHTDKQIKIINGNEVWQGICRGIGDDGELLVETENGMKQVISGEISVRGVYGYV